MFMPRSFVERGAATSRRRAAGLLRAIAARRSHCWKKCARLPRGSIGGLSGVQSRRLRDWLNSYLRPDQPNLGSRVDAGRRRRRIIENRSAAARRSRAYPGALAVESSSRMRRGLSEPSVGMTSIAWRSSRPARPAVAPTSAHRASAPTRLSSPTRSRRARAGRYGYAEREESFADGSLAVADRPGRSATAAAFGGERRRTAEYLNASLSACRVQNSRPFLIFTEIA